MAGTKRNVTKKTIKPKKDIVASIAESMKKDLLKLIKQGIKELTIDFAVIETIDSVGLGVLIATHNSLESAGGKLKIKNVSNNIYKIFKTMRLDQHFEVVIPDSE